jgi:adenylate kinase family enzyme
MYEIIFIVGLPGSGKTTLAYDMFMEYQDHSILRDDYSLHYEKEDIMWTPYVKRVIITDPRLCGVSERDAITLIEKRYPVYKDADFRFIYFDNDPEACIINSRRSPKPGGTENLINYLTKIYTIPANADIRKVYRET